MPCLETFDLVAYPDSIFVTQFAAPTEALLRQRIAEALEDSGWTITPVINTFECVSQGVPWCAPGARPAEFIGKTRVHISRIDGSTTGFVVMNEGQTMVQPSSFIWLRTTTGSYANYQYLFIGCPYQFVVFMLGVTDRVTNGIPNTQTALMCGTPQVPSFLQTRGSGWCEIGVEEMFFLTGMNNMRRGALVIDGGDFWCGGIKSLAHGSFLNNGNGGSPFASVGRFGLYLTYGGGGGGLFDNSNNESGLWVYDVDHPTDPTEWDGLYWPPIICWATDPANPSTTNRMKGFTWGSVISNKNYPADQIQNFAGHDWIVFNDNWVGAGGPYRPPGSLLFAIN